MTVHVRPADHGDVPQIVAFNVAMAEETEDKGLDADVLSDGVIWILEHPEEGRYLVAELDGEAVGAAMLTFEWSDWRNGRFWWIQSVFVDAAHRRRGVYTALHESMRSAALEDPQACGIRLYVERDNRGAQHTYQTLGMHETDYDLYEEEFRR